MSVLLLFLRCHSNSLTLVRGLSCSFSSCEADGDGAGDVVGVDDENKFEFDDVLVIFVEGETVPISVPPLVCLQCMKACSTSCCFSSTVQNTRR